MRTLLRPGRVGVLVKIDGRGGPRFYVDGPERADQHTFFELAAAERQFEGIEQGQPSRLERRPSLAFLPRVMGRRAVDGQPRTI
jgi:hypothetical protein